VNLRDSWGVVLVAGVGNVSIICPARASNAIDGHTGEGLVVVRAIGVVRYRRLQVPKGLTSCGGLETLHC